VHKRTFSSKFTLTQKKKTFYKIF